MSSAQYGTFYTDNLSTPLRVAQVVGLTSTAFFAGNAFVGSAVATPALLQSPAPLLAKQWKKLTALDKIIAPAVAVFGSGVFGFIASRDNAWTKTSILYATSASLLAALVPYSFFVGHPLVQQLEDKERNLASASLTDANAEIGVSKDRTVHALVDQWASFNFGRFVIVAISSALATWAAVDRAEVVPGVARFATGANRMG